MDLKHNIESVKVSIVCNVIIVITVFIEFGVNLIRKGLEM